MLCKWKSEKGLRLTLERKKKATRALEQTQKGTNELKRTLDSLI